MTIIKKATSKRINRTSRCGDMFIKQLKLTRTANDLLIGIFFVMGSLLNFFEFTSAYGNVLYFLGSSILACRAIYNLKESRSFEQKSTEKEISHFYY